MKLFRILDPFTLTLVCTVLLVSSVAMADWLSRK